MMEMMNLVSTLANLAVICIPHATLFVPRNATRLSLLFSSFSSARDVRRMFGRNGTVHQNSVAHLRTGWRWLPVRCPKATSRTKFGRRYKAPPLQPEDACSMSSMR
jgi:hypothetical protein